MRGGANFYNIHGSKKGFHLRARKSRPSATTIFFYPTEPSGIKEQKPHRDNVRQDGIAVSFSTTRQPKAKD